MSPSNGKMINLADFSTPKGIVVVIVVVFLCAFAIWNLHYASFWLDSSLGLKHVPATEEMIRLRRFWAGLLFGVMLITGVLNIVVLYVRRKRAIKSAKGQWYDSPDLTKEDLYDVEGRRDD